MRLFRGSTAIATILACCSPTAAGLAAERFINFETAPVHPVALSSNGTTLAVCNLPDNRVELFSVSSGIPVALGNVPVGLDPVTTRFRTTNELWVVNHISSSVSIVDLAKRRVVASLDTRAGPADVVFAGSPTRAYVTCSRENIVQVFDPITRVVITNIVVDGERPRAMAVSPDGKKVYIAIFESGNGTTILGPRLTPVDVLPGPGVVRDPAGPHAGQNPPPNNGTGFSPPINPAIPSDHPPDRVSHIVRKNAAGRWLDDNNGDWTEFVSGTNAALSSRVEGWDLPDHDVAVLDTETLNLTYFCGLMNICMEVAVNPASGRITVVGTDATNERRFEPNLRGTFVHVHLAMIDPETGHKTIKDLNPHLDYQTRTLPQSERDKSIGDPRGMVWNSAGTRGYVSGMGSRNLLILGADGNRVRNQPIELGEGPTGIALDETRQRLYVLNRFSARISVLDTSSEMVVATVPFFDPTPEAIKAGRKHLYDTRSNSGLGQVSCASCHVDGRMDRLAWDLGNPSGDLLTRSNVVIIGGDPGSPTFSWFTFHPMKGPMVTQTFQDIIGHEPFHWRGDRAGLEEFNQTFTNLLGRDLLLTADEMLEFKDFLATIHFPPSLFRNFDDTLSTNLLLPEAGLPNGNAVRGRQRFMVETAFGGGEFQCSSCHKPPTGLELGLIRLGRQDNLPFKGPQLRNLADKLGMFLNQTNSRAGFGFMHDGRVDTLERFLGDGFDFEGLEAIADVTAFMLSFSGSDPMEPNQPAVGARRSLDVATSVGKQLTMTNGLEDELLSQMLSVAESTAHRADLVVHGVKDGLNRNWAYDRVMGVFQSDRNGETVSLEALLALASPDNELTFTVVPRGSGLRLGVDRDEDGFFDRTEIEIGLDPNDPTSRGTNNPPRLQQPGAVAVYPELLLSVVMQASDDDSPLQHLTFRLEANPPSGAAINSTNGLFTWTPSLAEMGTTYRIGIQVTDDGFPPLSDEKELIVVVSEYGPVQILGVEAPNPELVHIFFRAIPDKVYRLQFKSRLDDPEWTDGETVTASSSGTGMFANSVSLVPQRFFRIGLLE